MLFLVEKWHIESSYQFHFWRKLFPIISRFAPKRLSTKLCERFVFLNTVAPETDGLHLFLLGCSQTIAAANFFLVFFDIRRERLFCCSVFVRTRKANKYVSMWCGRSQRCENRIIEMDPVNAYSGRSAKNERKGLFEKCQFWVDIAFVCSYSSWCWSGSCLRQKCVKFEPSQIQCFSSNSLCLLDVCLLGLIPYEIC